MDHFKFKNHKGFTLIELVVVMIILGILAVVAIPRFIDLTGQAKAEATKAALGAVRSTLSIVYGESAANANPSFPASLTADDFANKQLPINKCNGQNGIDSTIASGSEPAGTATSATNGFWYVATGANAGRVGAYANASITPCSDTSGF